MKKLILVCLAVAAVATVNAQAKFGIKAGAGLSNYNLTVKGATPSANLGNKLGGYAGFVFNAAAYKTWGFQAELLYAYEGTKLGTSKSFFTNMAEADAQIIEPEVVEGLGLDNKMALSLNSHNIRLNAMATFTPGDGIRIMAGPYISYRVANSVRLNKNLENTLKTMEFEQNEIDDVKDIAKNLLNDNIKKFDFGVTMGAEYSFCCGLFIDFRYNLGIMNLLQQDLDLSALNAEPLNMEEENVDLSTTGITPRVKYHSIQLGLGYRF